MNYTPNYFDQQTFDIYYAVRDAIWKALNGEKKEIESIIGCDVDDLKEVIELQFEYGMNWKNKKKKWDISFIGDINKYNVRNTEQAKKYFNYKNIVPKLI